MAWDVIDSETLVSDASSVSFAAGLSGYKIFRVTAYIVKDSTSGNINMTLNNDTGANYDRQQLVGGSTTVSAGRSTGGSSLAVLPTNMSSSAGLLEVIIAKQVTGSAAMVLATSTANASPTKVEVAGRWNNTTALISRIDLIASAGNFAAGTVVVLEGLPD